MIYTNYQDRLKEIKMRPLNDIKAEIFEGFEDFVGTKAQIEAREKELESKASKAFKEEQNRYADKHNEIMDEFARELSKQYGTGIERADDKVYSAAYERGHSGGVADVESIYIDLVEIAEVALEAGKDIGRQEPAEDRR